MGNECHVSDDRWLTLRCQMRYGLTAKFQGTAECYTYIPETMGSFMKMLVRWKKGFFREAILIWKEPNKMKNKLLVFDSTFNALVNYSLIGLKIFFLYYIIYFIYNGMWSSIIYSFVWLSIWIFIFSTAYSSYVFNYKGGFKQFPYKIIYSYLYEMIFFLTIIPATIFLNKQNSWENRKGKV